MKQATPAHQPPVTATEAISAAAKLERWLIRQEGLQGYPGWLGVVQDIRHAARQIRDKGL